MYKAFGLVDSKKYHEIDLLLYVHMYVYPSIYYYRPEYM